MIQKVSSRKASSVISLVAAPVSRPFIPYPSRVRENRLQITTRFPHHLPSAIKSSFSTETEIFRR